jgi:chaperonin GroES
MLKPMFDQIIVKRLDDDGTSTGGIQLVGDSARDTFLRGKVVAVGPGRRSQQDVLISMNLKVGDVILFDRGIGTKFYSDRQEFLLMFEGDARGILE